ncbi:MAG: 3-phosphoshikimate 1-carboxyvinyltransferase [Gammaproteobacteria bacterium]|nr:3-phosphoshikimate 1-carboxyvinyltransferase [Gammaproteobacteria bacterium]
MKRWQVTPAARVAGSLRVPGDKSVSHRALMLGGLAVGTTTVEGFLDSEDCLATLAALRAMGVTIERPSAHTVRVEGVGLHGLRGVDRPLDMGNAGTAMRLFMGLLAGQKFDSTLVGDSSLMKRPMERAAGPLRQMGALIETADGKPPVRIRGGRRLHGIDFAMPVASAQVKSAVLLAGLFADGVTRVTEPATTRDHTERMLRGFGVRIERQGATISLPGGQNLRAGQVAVPADFSSAAFFMVAGSIAREGELVLERVGMNPTRNGLLEILRAMGADIRVELVDESGPEPVANLKILPARLRGIAVPRHLVPIAIDEFPVFFIAAASADGVSVLHGAEELRVKESDRLAVMAAGLAALGVEHELLPDGMRIVGRPDGAAFRGGTIDSHGDHRIAMSFAVASLRAAAAITIDDVANVATSFPGFAALANAIGLSIVEAEAATP